MSKTSAKSSPEAHRPKPIGLRPWFGGCTTVLGGLAGLLASIYSSHISSVWPFNLVSGSYAGPIAAGLFLLVLLVFGILFSKGMDAQLAAQEESASSLSQAFSGQLADLQRIVRSLPPDNYLVEFEDQYHTAFAQAAAALTSKDPESLKDAIHACLAGILLLALAYDNPTKSVRYSVNLMVMRLIPKEADKQEQLRARLRLCEPGVDLAQLEGTLDLLPEFVQDASQTDDPEDASASAIEISLPVPIESLRFDEGKSAVLPGAPAAWCSPEALQFFPDSLEVAHWIRNQSALRASVAEQAERYFRSDDLGKTVRSFVSLPFGLPDIQPGAVKRSIGVVNLHSSAPGLLGEAEARLFAPLTVPFRTLLALLWTELNNVDSCATK